MKEERLKRIEEIRREANDASPKELRKLHRELKKLEPGDGFSMTDRYPNLPMVLSIVSGAVSGILLMLTILALLLK